MDLISFGMLGSFLLDIPSLFLICVIVTKSPSKLKFIRPFLLKMVISEMILSNSLLWEYFSNINQSHFPFPLAKVNFFKYFGEAGGLVAIIVSWCALFFSVICTIELTIMRCAITYNFQTILKYSRGIPFVIVQLGEVIIVFAVVIGFCSQVIQGMHGFEQFVIRHNVSYILKEFDVEHDVVTFFDLDSPTFRPLLFFTIVFIIFLPFVLSGLTYFTHRKIMKEAHRMSTENRSLQTRLTALLLAQILLPVLLVDVPIACFIFRLAIVFSLNETDPIYREVFDRPNLGFYIVATPIVLYPFFNTVATIIIIKPYRQAIFQLFTSRCKCYNRVQSSPIQMPESAPKYNRRPSNAINIYHSSEM